MQRVRVGVIGLGEVAQIIHLPVLEARLVHRAHDDSGQYATGGIGDGSAQHRFCLSERRGRQRQQCGEKDDYAENTLFHDRK